MNFIKKVINNILNIYVEEKDIREAYGSEYADRYSNLNPKTGKKMISARKIFVRIVAAVILFLYIFLMVRISVKGFWIQW